MRLLILLLTGWLLSYASLSLAGQGAYDDCLLKHLKGAKLDEAAGLITQACRENYLGPFYPNDKTQQFNSCLLDHLVGIESFRATMEIRNACASKYLH